jgi:hypothetical protein
VTGPYDRDQRAAAARLQQAHPAWLVLYGPWTRRYYAFPRFAVPPGTIAAAATAGELASLMQVTELEARPGLHFPGGR